MSAAQGTPDYVVSYAPVQRALRRSHTRRGAMLTERAGGATPIMLSRHRRRRETSPSNAARGRCHSLESRGTLGWIATHSVTGRNTAATAAHR